MLKPETISRIRPRGLAMNVVDVQVETTSQDQVGLRFTQSERRFYEATVSGTLRNGSVGECKLKFSLPIAQNGIFMVHGQRRFITHEAIPDIVTWKPGEVPSYIFRKRTEILTVALHKIFNDHLTEFFFGGQPPSDIEVQASIDSWFRNSHLTQEAPMNIVGLNSLIEMSYLRAPYSRMDLTYRRFHKSMLGIVDPCSTPANEKVNLAYRLAKGAKILPSGAVQKSENVFCSTIMDNAMPVCLTPRRGHLLRSSLEQVLDLEQSSKPVLGTSKLGGQHLLTAIMRYRTYTGEDAIVISKSAAVKLRMVRTVVEQFYSVGAIHLKVREGEEILPDTVIAETTDPVTGELVTHRAKRILGAAKIEEIVACQSSQYGIPATRVRLRCTVLADCEDGDKLFTRSAVKGVARVVPDEFMPRTKDGRIIEVCISPESVVGRRAMGVYWEMMATQWARDGKPVLVDHFDPRPTFRQLVEAGYGESTQLYWDENNPLQEKTFIGEIFFLRLSKIAREIVSWQHGRKAMNGMNLPVNATIYCGQKCDPAKKVGMATRGWNQILMNLSKRNMHASYALRHVLKILDPSVKIPEKVTKTAELERLDREFQADLDLLM